MWKKDDHICENEKVNFYPPLVVGFEMFVCGGVAYKLLVSNSLKHDLKKNVTNWKS
jgi:hypothetical protein